jgi:hypothetical protein
MAQILRKHGQVEYSPQYGTYGDQTANTTGGKASFFSGYQPLFIKLYDSSSLFTADTVDGVTGEITYGGRTRALQVIATFGSILMVDIDSNTDYITVIVDAGSFNSGSTMNESDVSFGALDKALLDALGYNGTTSWAVSITANGNIDW